MIYENSKHGLKIKNIQDNIEIFLGNQTSIRVGQTKGERKTGSTDVSIIIQILHQSWTDRGRKKDRFNRCQYYYRDVTSELDRQREKERQVQQM